MAKHSTPAHGTSLLVASAVAGLALGGAAVFGAAANADNTQLPTDEQIAVNQDNAFLGAVQYGSR